MFISIWFTIFFIEDFQLHIHWPAVIFDGFGELPPFWKIRLSDAVEYVKCTIYYVIKFHLRFSAPTSKNKKNAQSIQKSPMNGGQLHKNIQL